MRNLRIERKLQHQMARRVRIFQERNSEYPARIGNLVTSVVKVPGKSNTVYVTMQLTGNVEQAVTSIPSFLGAPVIVGYLPGAAGFAHLGCIRRC
jgi:hypothetical protein